jgi:putative hydrolase of the HAD superfamily
MEDREKSKLVVFDLGRVLIRICDSWDHACECAGIAKPQAPMLDDPAKTAAEQILGHYDSGAIDTQTFAREIAPFRGLRPQDVVRILEVYLRGPYPGVTDLLDDLHRAGVATACLSNTTDIHWKMIHDVADPNCLPMDRLTHRFASFQLGLRKPDPAIYEHVERTTGLRGEQIVFFDDAAENVRAAQRCGWNAHVIATDRDPIVQSRQLLKQIGVLV